MLGSGTPRSQGTKHLCSSCREGPSLAPVLHHCAGQQSSHHPEEASRMGQSGLVNVIGARGEEVAKVRCSQGLEAAGALGEAARQGGSGNRES